VAVYQPNGAPAAYALSERAEVDKIPLITLGYGRTEATDGTVFPYNFPVMLTFYSEASSLINYIAQREGGFDKLKGKKIATVYHDSAYGRETLGPLKLLAEKYGFENIQIPVADPGNEQSAQWRQIRQTQPGLGVPAHLGRVDPGGGQDRRAFRLPGGPHRRRHLGQFQRRRAARRRCRQGVPGADAIPGRHGFRDS
jgi:ABC-type branched-subunit amino acid transport system substrate-binding protein